MSQINNKQQEELRHERKFLISDFSVSDVKQILKFHPACFSEIYHEREVNNIYFDTLGFDSYYGNLEGDTDRVKSRIRWYDSLFGEITNATLEFKIKKGLLGKKQFYSLSPFNLDTSFSRSDIGKALSNDSVPLNIRNELMSLQPVLLNSYVRKYYMSADKRYRITIDSKLKFHRISYNKNTFLNKVVNHNAVILELKYDSEFEDEAKEIGNKLPFMMTKNSKYLQGIESVLF
jgi:SPX domain protein involved in polyphosphate accumulation